MNVALPTLVIFLLVLPGFVFRNRFKRAERTALDYAPFGRVVAEAVLWAAVLHGLWLYGAWLFRGQILRLDLLLGLLASGGPTQAATIAALSLQADSLAEYFGSLLVASYIVPAGLRAFITWQRLDRLGHWLAPLARFNDAPWYYLLTGADFSQDKLPDLIKVAAIVDVAGVAVLYQGFLEDFYFKAEGGLDRLVLQGVSRRLLSNDAIDPVASFDADPMAVDESFYPIDGDYFVLRYSEIITLNIQYITLRDQAG